MSQINSNTKDDFQVVFQLSCFVGHPVSSTIPDVNPRDFEINHLLPWEGLLQIFHSMSQYSNPYKCLL